MVRCLAVILAVCALLEAQEPPEKILERALALHQSGDSAGAIREYRAYLKLRPGAVEIRSNLGAALARAGRYEEAVTEYRQALAKDANNPPVLLNLALAYYKSGKYTDAAQQLALVRALEPENQQALLLEADCHLRLGNNKRVIELLSPLEKSSPGNLGVAYMLGTALVRDQQPERGQVLIDQILKNGDSAEARLLMGTTKMMVNDYAGARADLQRAVELNPKLPDVYSYYGTVLLRTGDTAGAIDAYQKELTSNPNDFTSNLQLGALARLDQDFQKAIPYLEQALRLRPGDPGVRFQMAAAHFGQGRLDQARGEFEKLIKDSPEFPEAHVMLATIYYRLKRKEDGDRERAIAQKLTAQRQAREPAAQTDTTGAPVKNLQ